MKLTITVKQLGKKHPILNEKAIELDIPNSILSLEKLLKLIIAQQVEAFNSSSFEIDDEDKTKIPLDNYLPILIDTGKVGFEAVYNHNKPDLHKAQETALQAFEDGMFVVFYGEDEIKTLQQEIDLQEEKSIMFIRLTFLAGSYW